MTNEEKMWILAVAEAVMRRDDMSLKNLREEVITQIKQEVRLAEKNVDPFRT